MNKSLKTILIILAILAGIWFTGKITGAFQFFSTKTVSGYPTVNAGDQFLVSNLVKPKRFDLVCYYAYPEGAKKEMRLHRLCGIEGDKIEIKDGDLYVNDKYVDTLFTIAHTYTISKNDITALDKIVTTEDPYLREGSIDSFSIDLSDKIVRDKDLKFKRYTLEKDHPDPEIEKQYSEKWNQDHFGPIIVPTGKFFVLGDNRLNSLDSRYSGFIDKKDHVGTVIWRP